jgi:hypothetical protein
MSTERLTPDPLSPQDKEWEANMLSFVEKNEGNGAPIPSRKKLPVQRRSLSVILAAAGTVLLAVVLLFVMLFATSVAGIVTAAYFWLRKHDPTFPFAPAIAIGFLVALVV